MQPPLVEALEAQEASERTRTRQLAERGVQPLRVEGVLGAEDEARDAVFDLGEGGGRGGVLREAKGAGAGAKTEARARAWGGGDRLRRVLVLSRLDEPLRVRLGLLHVEARCLCR